MFSRDERKQIWTMVAALLVVLVGVAITASSSHFVGFIITIIGSLILCVGGLRMAAAARRDERKQLFFVLGPFLILVVGFEISIYSSLRFGVIIGLVGVLVMFAGTVIVPVISKYRTRN